MIMSQHLSKTSPPPLVRSYQGRAIKNIIARLDTKPVLVAPTGSGKTVMLAKICQELGRRLLWVVHRRELLSQAESHLDAAGVKDRVVMSVQKQARRPIPDVDVIVVDECHHATEHGQYRKLFDADTPVIGATATPFRLDGRGLGGNLFGSLVVAATTAELVNQGFLFEPVIYSHSAPDMTGVKKRLGDYAKGETIKRTNKPRLIADIVETWIKKAFGLRTLVFAVNVEHSKSIRDAFREVGIKAEHVDAKTPKKERDRIFSVLALHEIDVVCNVGIVTEGYDLPALDCAVVARPTASLCLWLQIAGRVMRPEGQALLLDHSGNALRHGSPLRPIEYTLDDTVKQKVEPLGVRMCPECFIMVKTNVWTCPDCGFDMSPASRAKIKIGKGELVEFIDKAAVWEQLKNESEYKKIFGVYPCVIDGKLIEPNNLNREIIYKHYVRIAYKKTYQVGWAANQYKLVYGKFPKGFARKVRAQVFNERYKRERGIK